MAHKAGFVNIIGKPNVGKSTLMNAMVGEKLSIVTSKVQTTRHRIIGIINGDDYQLVFSDTPGIIDEPSYRMQEGMMQFVDGAFMDADVIVYVSEVGEKLDSPFLQGIIAKLQKAKVPVLVVINKIDLTTPEALEEFVDGWSKQVPKAEILPVSALHKLNADVLLKKLVSLMPESPPYYPDDQLTDKSERFFVSEIIREKILLQYSKEIPYSVEVVVEEFKEEPNIIKIRAVIFVMKESQKAIILGHQGKAIKRMGTEARKDIEEFVQKKVFLELTVKVNKDWRDNDNQLKKFGYLN